MRLLTADEAHIIFSFLTK